MNEKTLFNSKSGADTTHRLSLADVVAPEKFRPTGSMEIKRALVPESWKANLDNIMRDELMGANRYFAANNPNLEKGIVSEAQKSSEQFLADLRARWDWHNRFLEDILEPAMRHLIEKSSMALSVRQVELLAQAYETTSLIDQATLISTGAIKNHLENCETPFSHLTELEQFLLRIRPGPLFDIEYYQDHLQLIYLERTDPKVGANARENLLLKYHVGDPIIMSGRMQKFEKYLHVPIETLARKLEMLV